MYGAYSFPATIETENILISVEREEKRFLYRREFQEEKVEKILAADSGQLTINPVEPLNKPVEVTSFMQIEFENSIVVEPKTHQKIYLTFPIEIGVFVTSKRDVEVLDVLTLVRQKYTLYGEPSNGVICRYWKSGVYSEIPETDRLREGVMELTINNEVGEWVEVNKAVFNAVGMKIYYNDMVSMRATMELGSKTVAETDFRDSPLKSGMKKSIELYTARKVPIVGRKMIMGWGL
ncbi:MAG: DUF432 domain-containing protein [Archaeoglobaceae archaeon]